MVVRCFKFNESISFIINCKDQKEIDDLWEKLSADPGSEQCGWLKDKYGLSWQITPENMDALMTTDEAFAAMLKMKKINIEELRKASEKKMSKIELAPYIFFKGNCAEAMNFYKKVFGGKLDVMKYDDVPVDMPGSEEMKGKIMNSSLETDFGFTIRASDSPKASDVAKKVELCLTGSNEDDLRKIFEGLSVGAQVRQKLEKMFWGDFFGH